jgi:hypothetical protein
MGAVLYGTTEATSKATAKVTAKVTAEPKESCRRRRN